MPPLRNDYDFSGEFSFVLSCTVRSPSRVSGTSFRFKSLRSFRLRVKRLFLYRCRRCFHVKPGQGVAPDVPAFTFSDTLGYSTCACSRVRSIWARWFVCLLFAAIKTSAASSFLFFIVRSGLLMDKPDATASFCNSSLELPGAGSEKGSPVSALRAASNAAVCVEPVDPRVPTELET